jgi:hypothetical protein
VTGALNKPLRWIFGAGAVALLLIAITASRADAATFPNGGSPFNGNLEGWVPVQEECKALGLLEVEVLCEAKGEYDATAGALDAKTKLALNLVGTFNSKVAFRSPDFTVTAAGPATLHLDRQFALGGLLNLAPTGGYSVVLMDRSTGTQTVVLQEGLDKVSEAFAGKDAAVSVASGHTYALQIQAEVAGNVTLGLNATGDVRFDNVGLNVTPTSSENPGGGSNGGNGAGGGDGGNGVNSLSSSRLGTLLRSSMTGSATLKGNRVFVKAQCPAKVGAACRVTVQGLLGKGKPATAPRTAKIAKGKSRQLVLKLKPKLKKLVAKRKKLLFKETVKAAQTKATVYKRIKLIRR